MALRGNPVFSLIDPPHRVLHVNCDDALWVIRGINGYYAALHHEGDSECVRIRYSLPFGSVHLDSRRGLTVVPLPQIIGLVSL